MFGCSNGNCLSWVLKNARRSVWYIGKHHVFCQSNNALFHPINFANDGAECRRGMSQINIP